MIRSEPNNGNSKTGFKSLFIKKLSGFLNKKLFKKVTAWSNLYLHRETCFEGKCAR